MEEIDQYIQRFPEDVQKILHQIRRIILQEIPEAQERMAYGMPGYYLQRKPVVYFAAYKNHIGLYATPSGHEYFAEKLAGYKKGKGSVQFSLKEAMPYGLIAEMVRFRHDVLRNPVQ